MLCRAESYQKKTYKIIDNKMVLIEHCIASNMIKLLMDSLLLSEITIIKAIVRNLKTTKPYNSNWRLKSLLFNKKGKTTRRI